MLAELVGLAVAAVAVAAALVVAVVAGYIGVAGLLEVAAPALHFQQVLRKNRRTYLPHQSYFRNLYKTSKPSITHSTISFIERTLFSILQLLTLFFNAETNAGEIHGKCFQ